MQPTTKNAIAGNATLAGILIVIIAIGSIAGAMIGLPKYRVYSQTLRGEAALREAEWTKKILLEGATAQAEAEIKRATATAEANQIIGDSLKGNDDYLRYLWIMGLKDDSGERIYIPTEAGLPILLEARTPAPPIPGVK